ncbi:MAG: hypothetical protein D6805_00615 [Planctomycetota bacterium]|nr:MAG: hypothetical protein D6805_00615 [Planctomycetota bacterium]
MKNIAIAIFGFNVLLFTLCMRDKLLQWGKNFLLCTTDRFFYLLSFRFILKMSTENPCPLQKSLSSSLPPFSPATSITAYLPFQQLSFRRYVKWKNMLFLSPFSLSFLA